MRLALFLGGLATNLDNDGRREYVDAGAQIDLRLVLFTYTKPTFSAGFAAAHDRTGTYRNRVTSLACPPFEDRAFPRDRAVFATVMGGPSAFLCVRYSSPYTLAL